MVLVHIVWKICPDKNLMRKLTKDKNSGDNCDRVTDVVHCTFQ